MNATLPGKAGLLAGLEPHGGTAEVPSTAEAGTLFTASFLRDGVRR